MLMLCNGEEGEGGGEKCEAKNIYYIFNPLLLFRISSMMSFKVRRLLGPRSHFRLSSEQPKDTSAQESNPKQSRPERKIFG